MTALAADSHLPERLAASTVRDYVTLLKPGVMSLVVFSGLAGMLMALNETGIRLHPLQQFLTLLCIALGSGAGGAMNMWYDRDIDAVMLRTAGRPIPAGRIAPSDALALGLFLAVGAVTLMGIGVGWVAGLLLAGAIAFYVVVYTHWLKRSTPQNIVIGGAAGAFPPMIGWAAVSGDVTWASLLLFAIIFLWTPPHFWALALFRNGDYARAGVPMMPVVAGKPHTRRLMAFYAVLLLISTLLLPLVCHLSIIYTASAAALGVIFLYYIARCFGDEGDRWPRRTFVFSIYYLFVLFTVMMIDSSLPRLGAMLQP